MGHLVDQMQVKLKKGSTSFFLYLLRLVSGFMVGLTLSLVGKELVGYKETIFVFVIVITIGIFLRVSRKWGYVSVLLFDLAAVLVAILLKMYVLVAPGA